MAGRTDVKISVIVPVYNVEKELPRCIESLLTQTYLNFELLLINDGSSDGSPEIMERYAEKDPRIRTLHKKNGGVSSARNRGLEQAKGEYVCFVDADDAVAPQYMEWLYLALRQSGEAVAICRDVRVNDFEKEAPFKALPEKMPETERMDLRQYTFWDENGCLWCCRGMMKTESLRDIRYDEELSIGEDALFMAKALLKAGGYIYLPCGLYAYYMRDGSALHQETFKPKQFSEITAWERIYALIREQRRPGEERMERTAEERLAVVCAHVYYRMAGSDHADPELQAKIVRMAREHWRAALRVPNSKKREKSKLWMLICCPAAGRWMWRLGKKLKQG